MSESDERFMGRLRDEAERLLGAGARIERLERSEAGEDVCLAAFLDTPIGPRVVEATGASIVDTAGQLISRLPEERLALAFRRLVAEEERGRART